MYYTNSTANLIVKKKKKKISTTNLYVCSRERHVLYKTYIAIQISCAASLKHTTLNSSFYHIINQRARAF